MSRIKFKKNQQAKFILEAKNVTSLGWSDIAEKLNITPRTLTNWKEERFTLSENAFKKLLEISGGKIKNVGTYEVLPDFWSVLKAAKKGGIALAKKYGGPGTPDGRKKGGRSSQKRRRLFPELYRNCNLRKAIKIPEKSSDLAEFIGIFLGDGGISNASQITISFNKENGGSYFHEVKKIIEKLFGIKAVVYNLSSRASTNVIRLVVSSANLVDFLGKNKIKPGNKIKNQVDVPIWIKKNQKYAKNCLRGLIDTDGGVYYHRHSNCRCKSFNIGLCFTNKSKPLLDFVEHTLSDMGFHPKRSWSGENILLYRESEVLLYNREVGFRNYHQHKRLVEYLKIKKRKGAGAV